MNPSPSRLIDLHVDWPLQYSAESTIFDPAHYPNAPKRISQAEGYLGATSAAFVACYRNAADWATRADPWKALGALIARVEAEFSGRILIGPADRDRWKTEPEGGLTWAVLGIEGFDALIRENADLARLSDLFARGVRLFQPVYGPSSVLAGSSASGDERRLSDLGTAFLETLAEVSSVSGPRPIVDLAHLNPASASDVLDWFEADPGRLRKIIPAYSHGSPVHDGFSTPRAITIDNLRRLRGLGGVVGYCVGPPFFESAEALRSAIESTASIPRNGSAGYEGIAIGSDFLGVDQTLPGLGNADGILAWLKGSFDEKTARMLMRGNAENLIDRMIEPPDA